MWLHKDFEPIVYDDVKYILGPLFLWINDIENTLSQQTQQKILLAKSFEWQILS